MTHSLPQLPWALDALEPHYLKSTLEYHYGKHHQTYVTKLNEALAGTGLENRPLEQLVSNMKDVPEAKRQAITNHGGGHYNHTLFWFILGPNGGGNPSGKLAEAINKSFGSFTAFKEKFSASAVAVFGSGWTWLTVNTDGSLNIENSPNQENCLMNSDRKPVMVLDLWEHAYYLEHQNRRPDFINVFWNMVNWSQVEKFYESAISGKTIIDLQAVAA